MVSIQYLLCFRHMGLRGKRQKKLKNQWFFKVLCGKGLGGRFWCHLGSILGPFGGHVGPKIGNLGAQRRSGAVFWAVPKSTEKKVRKKSCGCPGLSAGVGGVAPLKHYNIGEPGGHLTPYDHTTGALEARWRIIDWRHGAFYGGGAITGILKVQF